MFKSHIHSFFSGCQCLSQQFQLVQDNLKEVVKKSQKLSYSFTCLSALYQAWLLTIFAVKHSVKNRKKTFEIFQEMK